MLTNPELELITKKFLVADGKKATDIYFETSWLMEHLMKNKGGLFERPNGGSHIEVPLKYDGAEAGFYMRNEALNEDDRQNITVAKFNWCHAFGNATIYRVDELKNAGEYAEVALVESKITDAMESCRDMIASNLYNGVGDGSKFITGLLSLTNGTGTVTYGNIAADNLVAQDGTKPWRGITNTTGGVLSLDLLRGFRSQAKIKGGPKGKPNLLVTTETLYNKVLNLLTLNQRYTPADQVVKAGFVGCHLDDAMIVVDDYCPSGYVFGINTNHCGFAVHSRGYFARDPWTKLSSGAVGRTMKIFWDGNLIANHRRAHIAASGLTAS
jgi:hypothetical protein